MGQRNKHCAASVVSPSASVYAATHCPAVSQSAGRPGRAFGPDQALIRRGIWQQLEEDRHKIQGLIEARRAGRRRYIYMLLGNAGAFCGRRPRLETESAISVWKKHIEINKKKVGSLKEACNCRPLRIIGGFGSGQTDCTGTLRVILSSALPHVRAL